MANDSPKVHQKNLTTKTNEKFNVTKAIEKSVAMNAPIKSAEFPTPEKATESADQPPPRSAQLPPGAGNTMADAVVQPNAADLAISGEVPVVTQTQEINRELLSGQGGMSTTAEIVPTPASIPGQYLAPVRVEERNGKIALARHEDSELLAAERDFNDWRDPIIEHIQELSSSDFRQGTNHSRVRDRLVSLGNLLPGSIAQVKERQFRIGYEVERLGGLISAYRSGGDDMPMLNAAVLEDLDQLHLALRMGIDKLQRWAEFRRQAADDPDHDGDANPVLVGDALEKMAAAMEVEPKYFAPELPTSFRLIVEALRDPAGATKTIVYGAVKSAENLISFLAKRALGVAKSALEGVEQHISKGIASALIVGLGGSALMLSGALPQGWAWLKPLLEYLMKMGGH